VGYGTSVTVSGLLTKQSGGVTDGASGAGLLVLQLPEGATTPTLLGKATTRYDGSYSVDVKLTRTGTVSVLLPASTAYQSASSEGDGIEVALWEPEITVTSVPVKDVAYGKKLTIAGSVTRTAFDTSGGAPALKLRVTQQVGDAAETILGYVTTTSTGTFLASVAPTWNSTLRVRVAGVVGYTDAVSEDIEDVTVALGISLAPSTTIPRPGASMTWTVKAAPARGVTLAVQRPVNGDWTTVQTVALVNGAGKWVTTAPSVVGTYTYRVVFAGDEWHQPSVSTTKTVKVA
jgi:hypothetical protein